MSLQRLKSRIPTHQRTTVEIDISDYLAPLTPEEIVAGAVVEEGSQGEEESFLVLHEPMLSQVGEAQRTEKQVRINYPDLDFDNAYHVRLFALVHKTPADTVKGATDFYATMALENPPAFAVFRARFYAAFPWLSDVMSAAEEKKRASQPQIAGRSGSA